MEIQASEGIYALSFYDDFECSCRECRMDCCSGWRIALSDEDRERFLNEKGLLGLKLRSCIKSRSDIYMLNPGSGRCRFHNSKGLCSLQLEKGEDFIPFICRKYPRRIKSFGAYGELKLDLTCFHAASLFLEGRGDIGFARYDRPLTETEKTCLEIPANNDDTQFLSELLSIREYWAKRVGRTENIRELNDVISLFADFALKGQNGLAAGKSLKDSLSGYEEKDSCGDMPSFFPPDMMMVHEFVSSDLTHNMLSVTAPFLYSLLDEYYDTFSGRAPSEAGRMLEDMFEKYLSSDDRAFYELRDYTVYSIYSEFAESYEDYSIASHSAYTVTEAVLISVFTALIFHRKGSLQIKDKAMIISAVLRRIRHNDEIKKELLRIFMEHITKKGRQK